jgi:hypothetical protein
MLSSLYLKLSLIVCVVLTACIGVVYAQPHESSDVRDFFTPSEDCALPCWFSIRPGETDLDDAIVMLGAHPWVGPIMFDADIASSNREGAVLWHWNGAQPAYINPQVDRRLATANNHVQYVFITTTIPMGDVQAYLGAPERGMMVRAGAYQHQVFHYAVYGGISARSRIACPVWVADVWRAQTEFNLSPEVTSAAFLPYNLREWLLAPPCAA